MKLRIHHNGSRYLVFVNLISFGVNPAGVTTFVSCIPGNEILPAPEEFEAIKATLLKSRFDLPSLANICVEQAGGIPLFFL